MWTKFKGLLYKPTDIAFLVYFRIFMGGFISGEMINQLFTEDYLNYVEPEFHFTYQFFPWVNAFPKTGMYLLFATIILSGILVAVGWMYRWFSALLFFSYTAMFLMEKSEYVNHFYLYCTFAFLMMFLPANRSLSIDVKRKPSIRIDTVPSWIYFLFIFQMGIVYFYAGVAKLHTDWLEARAMSLWMAAKSDIPLIGNLLSRELTPWLMSYAGMIFDLLVVPFLLWRRTRIGAFLVACFFHLTNVAVFGLATFPWFSLMATSLFFGPSWSRKLPFFKQYLSPKNMAPLPALSNNKTNRTLFLLVAFALFQILIPLRHFLYPQHPNWTEEGHRFAWHMMLRSKYPVTSFLIVTANGKITEDGSDFLTDHQKRKMGGNPEMILEFAHFLKKKYEARGEEVLAVHANSLLSLNGRPFQVFIDPDVDLAKEKRSLMPYSWILPLKE